VEEREDRGGGESKNIQKGPISGGPVHNYISRGERRKSNITKRIVPIKGKKTAGSEQREVVGVGKQVVPERQHSTAPTLKWEFEGSQREMKRLGGHEGIKG